MRAMRMVLVLASVLLGCNTPVRSERAPDEHTPKDAPPNTAAFSAPRGSSVSAPESPKVALAATSSTVVLLSGATLKLPAGADLATAPSELPPEVKRARVWKFSDESRLMLNEFSLAGEGCEAVLEREWLKLKAAETDTDPERLKFRRMKSVEKLELEGRRALYSASTHGTGSPGESASLATLIVCTPADYLVAMFAQKNGDAAAETKAKLLALVGSYRAP